MLENNRFLNPSFAVDNHERFFRRSCLNHCICLILYNGYREFMFRDDSGRGVGARFTRSYGNPRSLVRDIEDRLGPLIYCEYK